MLSVLAPSPLGVDPRNFERRLPKRLALLFLFGVSLLLWAAFWFVGAVVVSLIALLVQ